MESVLITGGAGFIGSSLAEMFCKTGRYDVTVVDNLQTGAKEKVPELENCSFIKGDVNKYDDIAPIMFSHRFKYVFHYAATVGVKRTLDNPIMVLNDIDGIKNVLSLSRKTGVKRVFYASSSEVYGEPVELPQHEVTTPLNSRLPYAVVKNVGESFCRSFEQEYKLPFGLFRFFNTYGPKQSTDFVISKFIKAATLGEDITVYGEGDQTRTFCYIDDNLDATLKIMEEGLIMNDVINLGSDVVTTIKELASNIIDVTGSSSKIVHLPPLPEGDMTRRMPDNRKMREILSRDLMPLSKGLEHVLSSPFLMNQS